jgi:hypothetical protein
LRRLALLAAPFVLAALLASEGLGREKIEDRITSTAVDLGLEGETPTSAPDA